MNTIIMVYAQPPPDILRVKLLSMGDETTGKSCLIKRYCEDRFVSKYIRTVLNELIAPSLMCLFLFKIPSVLHYFIKATCKFIFIFYPHTEYA